MSFIEFLSVFNSRNITFSSKISTVVDRICEKQLQ